MRLRFNRPVVNIIDMERSLEFYRDILGMKINRDDTIPNSEAERQSGGRAVLLAEAFGVFPLSVRYVIMEVPGEWGEGREIELIEWRSPMRTPVPENWKCSNGGVAWLAFNVDGGLREMYDKLKSYGVRFRGEFTEFKERGRGIFYAIDPDNYTVEFNGPL